MHNSPFKIDIMNSYLIVWPISGLVIGMIGLR